MTCQYYFQYNNFIYYYVDILIYTIVFYISILCCLCTLCMYNVKMYLHYIIQYKYIFTLYIYNTCLTYMLCLSVYVYYMFALMYTCRFMHTLYVGISHFNTHLLSIHHCFVYNINPSF